MKTKIITSSGVITFHWANFFFLKWMRENSMVNWNWMSKMKCWPQEEVEKKKQNQNKLIRKQINPMKIFKSWDPFILSLSTSSWLVFFLHRLNFIYQVNESMTFETKVNNINGQEMGKAMARQATTATQIVRFSWPRSIPLNGWRAHRL